MRAFVTRKKNLYKKKLNINIKIGKRSIKKTVIDI